MDLYADHGVAKAMTTNQSTSIPVPFSDDLPYTVGGLQVLRSICNQVPVNTPTLDHSFTYWLAPFAPGQTDEARVIAVCGEVTTANASNTHMLGVTVAALVKVHGAVEVDFKVGAAPDDVREQIGNWAAHLLWDFSTAQLRMIASGLTDPQLELPRVTPLPTYVEPHSPEK